MMIKKKILIVGDFEELPSGFGKVVKNLTDGLEEHYTLYGLGCSYMGQGEFNTTKWRHYYPTSPQNPFGTDRIGFVYNQIKPDLTILIQDPWNIAEYLKAIPDNAKVIGYWPVDGDSLSLIAEAVAQDPRMKNSFAYSHHANKLMGTKYPILSHGVDTNVFKKVSFKLVEKFLAKYDIDTTTPKFIVGQANALSFRKSPALWLRATNLFAKKHDDVVVMLHSPLESISWDRDTALPHIALNSGWDQKAAEKKKLILTKTGDPLEEYEMNILFNAYNVFLTVAGGEGWGLTSMEALASSTPVIVPENSVFPELYKDAPSATILDCPQTINYPYDHSITRKLPIVSDIVESLEAHYQAWVDNGRKKVYATPEDQAHVEQFTWEAARGMLHPAIKKLI